MQNIIKKPYKIDTKNAKKKFKFSTFVTFLGPFLKKQCFQKWAWQASNGGSCPNTLYSFSMKVYEEALLKASTQKFSYISKLLVFEKHCFFKNDPKNPTKVKNFENIFAFLVTII